MELGEARGQKFMTSPLHEIMMIAHLLPEPVLKDITQRIGDWLAMGGDESDPYIEQQLRFAKRFLPGGKDDCSADPFT